MPAAKTYGQEIIRMSLAGAQAAAAARTATNVNYYNIQVGPVSLRFQGEMGIELTDNANYSSVAPDADIGLHPNLNFKAFWPVTEQNTLVVSTGVGYVEYLHDQSLSHLNINSDSGLAFNVYSGDFLFNLHDRFSATDYQVADPSVSASLIRLENTAGLAVTWDLNKLVLTAGYDHDTFHSLTESFQYSDNSSELLNCKAAFITSVTSRVGLEVGGGFTTYTEYVLDNSTHFSIGPFYQAQLTPSLGGQLAAGFATYQFDHSGSFTNVNDFTGYYASASLTHRLNDFFSETLTGGRQIQLGISANLVDDYFANYGLTWNFGQNYFSTFNVSFDHGSTSGGLVERYDRYGPGVRFGKRLSEKLVGSVSYSLLKKDSDVSSLSYTQNRILFDFTYDF